MKLRTQIHDGRLVGDDGDIDHQNIEWYQAEHVSHDAMAAHALMQAIESVHKDYPRVSASIGMPLVQRRADELMREWTKQDEVK